MGYKIIGVLKNENAMNIAKKYNITERSIFELNTPLFYEGERLVIMQNDKKLHTVMPFESIEDISKKYGISVEKLIALNGTNKFFLGENIIVDDNA